MKNISKHLVLGLIITLYMGILYADNPTQKPLSPSEVWLTVFIHGVVKGEWVRCSLPKVMWDHLDQDSTYKKAAMAVRNDPFFHSLNAMQDQGLKKVIPIQQAGASMIAYLYDTFSAVNNNDRGINYYYTFGWSGLCSQKMRFLEAKLLYKDLLQEIKIMREQHHTTPRIRLICYSHGGNVSLELVEVKQKDLVLAPLTIDELILLGVPVQRETDHFMYDPMFARIYHFYSPSDLVQIADFFSIKRFLSNKKFRPRNGLALPKKLTQIAVEVVKYTPRPRYVDDEQLLKKPLTESYEKAKVKKIAMNPRHTELWHLGWTPAWYRETFPLFPFPVVVFLSYITQQIAQEPLLHNDIQAILHPQRDLMYLKNNRHPTMLTSSFIPTSTLDKVRQEIAPHKPDQQFYDEHARRIQAAIHVARAGTNGSLVLTKRRRGYRHNKTKASMCLT